MQWERWRIPIMLAPTMFVIIVLFIGGLGYGALQSLGWNPRVGETELSLDAYNNILFSERYSEQFWKGLVLSLWVSFASTAISAAIAVGFALVLRQSFFGKRISTFLFQLNLPIPHVVAAIGMLFLFSQSGVLSRLSVELGWTRFPRDFPILVRDEDGWGIIMAYVWKEVPFIGVIVLAVLQSLGEDYEDLARTLGANRWQRFRHVILPLIMPALLSASVIVFAFIFGAYEVPAILGVRFPEMLPVMALDFFRNVDLRARSEGMAISIIISFITTVLIVNYMWLSRRVIR